MKMGISELKVSSRILKDSLKRNQESRVKAVVLNFGSRRHWAVSGNDVGCHNSGNVTGIHWGGQEFCWTSYRHRTEPHNEELPGQNIHHASLIKEDSTLNLRPPNSQARGTWAFLSSRLPQVTKTKYAAGGAHGAWCPLSSCSSPRGSSDISNMPPPSASSGIKCFKMFTK